MLDQSRTILREYSNEALIYIQKIKELEDESLRNGVQHVREHLNSLKGLVPVYLYGVIEKTLTTAFDEFFAIIKSKNISYNKIAGDFYPFIFTDELNTFKSVTTSKSKNLVKLTKVFDKIHADTEINEIRLHYIYENITNCWPTVLVDIYNLFGIDLEIDQRDQMAIYEIVEKRNAVAHGREKPTIAYVKAANDIIQRHALVSRVLENCISKLECYITDKMYLKTEYRQVETPQ